MLLEKDSKYQYLNFTDYLDLDNWSSYFVRNKKVFYNEKYPLVSIGSFLSRNKASLTIQDDELYKRPTIQMNAKGVKLRDEVFGRDIGTKNQFIIHKGQFLLSKIDARNGAFGVVPPELDNGVITGNFRAFDVNYSIINPFYLSILTGTQQFQDLCQTASVGTTNRNYLQERLFLNFEIPLPHIVEQDNLVHDYNTDIQEALKFQTAANTLEVQKKELLDKTFGIVENPIKPRKSFSFIEFCDLNRWGVSFAAYQSKWKISPKYDLKKIGTVCKVGSGGTPDKSKPGYFNGTIPWVKTTEVVNGVINSTEEKLTPEGLKNSSAKIYEKGALIIAMYGQGITRGRTAKLGIDAATNQACAVLYDINNGIILTDFLWTYLKNEYERLREMASGNNQPNLNAGMIHNYPVQIPPIDIQNEIINAVEVFDDKIEKLKLDAEDNKKKALDNFAKSVFY